MDKIFIDSDVILDLLIRRKDFFKESSKIFNLIEQKKVKAYTSPLIIANIYFILNKLKNKNFAKKNIIKIRSLLSITEINQKTIDQAIISSFKDFEDAIQYYSAVLTDLDYLITRNKKDYKRVNIIVFTPKEYLAARC
jgi:predicted nucleic acid-binding protein